MVGKKRTCNIWYPTLTEIIKRHSGNLSERVINVCIATIAGLSEYDPILHYIKNRPRATLTL